MRPVFTIGHSTHAEDHFLELLAAYEIEVVCDVRSMPFSRYNPQFNRERLEQTVPGQYVFLGRELGARSDDPSCYDGATVNYGRLAKTGFFQDGLRQVREAAQSRRVALLCAEKEPLECHRTILVSRHLADDLSVHHIHADGTLETHEGALARLLELLGLPECDLFRTNREIVEEAYRMQEERIAYEAPGK